MAINPFNAASDLRGDLNKETLDVAKSAYALPATVSLTPEPLTGDNNSLRTLMGESAPKTFLAAGGLVKKVVERQRQRVLPKMSAQSQYMADGGPVCKAEGGPVTEPRPTTMAEDTVPARLHPDEYVIPAEVVRKKGVDFFDRLVKNAQGERKGIVPTMKGGKMYAYEGGTGRDALDEDKAQIPLNTQAPKPAMLTEQVDSAIKNVNAGASKQAVQEANARIDATKIPLNTDTVKTGQSLLSRGVGKAIDAVNPKNFSPETQSTILKGGDAMLEGFKGAKQGLVGAIKSTGSQLAKPENQKALTNVTSLGLPQVADTLQRKGLVGAVGNAARFLAGNTESGKKFDAAVEAQDKRISDTLLYGAEGRPVAAKTDVGDVETTTSPTQTGTPSATPAVYSQESLPDGATRTALTAAGYQKAFGNEKPVTPEQIAAIDAADAKRLAGILNFDNDRVANFVKGQGGFDPIEQYKQKLAADAEYQRQRDVTKEIQFRNYGQVFPEERSYGQVDNSPVTKQMEIDAAKQLAEAKPTKAEKDPANKYRPVVDPVTGAITGTVPVEGPEADAAYAAQRTQAASNKSNLAYNLLNNPDAIDQYPEEERPRLLEAAKQWAVSDAYKNWLKSNQ